jgi:hypothetical protein
MTRHRLRLLAGLLSGAPMMAGAFSADDFARGREVTPDDAPVQRLVVPEDVYRWTTRADLVDLRVLDPNGGLVPFAVRAPRPEPPAADWKPLNWFALPGEAEGPSTPPSVNVQLGADGTIIAVQSSPSTPGTRAAYLLDTGRLTHPIASLRLRWTDEAADFVARVRLDDSDDLDHWRTLLRSAPLAQLGVGAERIVADRLELGSAARRYLRIRQLDDAPWPALTGVEAMERVPGETHRHRTRLAALPGTERRSEGRWEYDSGGHFPVDRLHLVPPERTFRAAIHLYSRPAAKADWRDHGRHALYAFASNGDGARAARSDPVELRPVSDRYWRVEWLVREGIADLAEVELEIAWQPHEVLFLRQGTGTHLLAYGRAGLEAGGWPITDLAARLPGTTLEGLQPRPLSEPRTLGGAARLEPAPSPFDWRTGVLWAVLLAGVLLVAALAYRLLR